MLRHLCRAVPALAIVCVLVSGCSRSHDARGGDEICDCCGTPVSIGPEETCSGGACDPYCGIVPPPDAGPDAGAPDGGGIDAGPLECPEHALDLACDVDTIVAGAPQTISVFVGGDGACYCGETIECRARVTGPRALAIETGLCADGPLCDACLPFIEGRCELPSLEAGTWEVDLNGRPGFELHVLEPGVAPEWGETCIRRGGALDVCAPTWPPDATVVDQACAPAGVLAGTPVPIELTQTCASACNAMGPCEVAIFDDVVRVTPSTWNPSCDISCPAVCEMRVETCHTPPLPAGTWRVFVEGYDAMLFTIDATDTGGDPGLVVCGGAASGG